jgi:hypothetical protein
MVHHITVADSLEVPSGNAFADSGPDFNFLIDANAFRISDSGGNGARFTGAGPWHVTVNGEVGAFGSGFSGMFFTPAAIVTVGKTGDVFGGSGISGIEFSNNATLTNFGTISGGTESITVAGVAHITNAGLFVGDARTGGSDDILPTSSRSIT